VYKLTDIRAMYRARTGPQDNQGDAGGVSWETEFHSFSHAVWRETARCVKLVGLFTKHYWLRSLA